MGPSRRPPSLARALEPYHYPEDEDGNPVPTPTPRSRPQSSTADPDVPVKALVFPLPVFLRRFSRDART
jgi:hypothetical protein